MGESGDAPERAWDQDELLRVVDAEPSGPPGSGRYTSPAHGPSARNVVEAGQVLASTVVAASKEVPDQRVNSASMVFSRVARHDLSLDVELDVLHRGRTYSTIQARAVQESKVRAAGTLLMGAESKPLIAAAVPPPEAPGPDEVAPYTKSGATVAGREIRIVDDAYDDDPDRVGPPELLVWKRFAAAPEHDHLHRALLTQSLGHWTIAAALRPHPGYSQAMAHHTISTGISKITVAFHDDVDITDWLLYATRVVYTGRGMTQAEGRVHDTSGNLVASFTVNGMLRPFAAKPASADASTLL